LFPRVGPLWGLPQDAGARTGLSGTLRLGQRRRRSQRRSIALRIRFDGAPPPPQALYLRGPVLSRFDGVEWPRSNPAGGGVRRLRRELRLRGEPVRYEMTARAVAPAAAAAARSHARPRRRRAAGARLALAGSAATCSGPPTAR
jgi:hypothetical protein